MKSSEEKITQLLYGPGQTTSHQALYSALPDFAGQAHGLVRLSRFRVYISLYLSCSVYIIRILPGRFSSRPALPGRYYADFANCPQGRNILM